MAFNPEYLSNLKDQIDGVQGCQELQRIADDVLAMYQAEKAAIEAQIAALQPLLALLTLNLIDLPSVIKFLKDFVDNFLTPYLTPHVTLLRQLAEQIIQVQEVIAALQAASERITDCSIEL